MSDIDDVREELDDSEPDEFDEELESDKGPVDFSMILASSVHDMKNSLAMLLDTIEVFFETSPPQNAEQEQQFTTLQYQATRVKNDLINLLGIYRLEDENLPAQIDQYIMADFLDEQIAYADVLLRARRIDVKLICDENALWYLDHDLISGVVNNVLLNAIRYAHNNLQITFYQKDGFGCVEIADDGKGYPKSMIENPDNYTKSINFRNGSTSLGLYFAAQVAKLHKRHKHEGYITIKNGGPLKGGVFTLHLP